MKRKVLHLLPWLITAAAIYFLTRELDWAAFFEQLKGADPAWLLFAMLLTVFSYLLRARRWQFLFPTRAIAYLASVRVLVLGFFMNNILPARAGELVRAHLGAKVTGEKRTLVLATVASERLADGLMLSLMFVLFAFGFENSPISGDLLYVAYLFGGIAAATGLALMFRHRIFKLVEKISQRIDHQHSDYASDRLRTFIDGLTPLCNWRKLPVIVLWTILIWLVELMVYVAVSQAYGAALSFPDTVLFMVTVNFSSLIPAAPGGIGVIEAVTTTVLVSLGIDREHALSMVFSQHMIQYLAVGVPGVIIMMLWKTSLRQMQTLEDE